MANNASATVDLKILISVIQNQSQAIHNIQQQFQSMLQQIQSVSPTMAGLASSVTGLNTQISGIQPNAAKGAAGLASLDRAVQSLIRGVKLLSGGFLAFEGVRFLKGLADAAARTEVLGTVLHVVATNAGVTQKAIDATWLKVQRLGITADAAAQSLTQLLQANIKLEYAAPLARAAQDLAVIEGSDSSATFERLITAIQTLNTLSLRRMGIIVSLTQAESKYRAKHKEIIGDLNAEQRSEALTMEVMDKSLGLQGTYEAAMGDVGKQVTSLKRFFEELRSELGKQLLPAFSAIVTELTLFLTQMTHLVQAGNENMEWAERFGEIVRVMARRFFEAVRFIYEHRLAIEALAAAYAAYWVVVTTKAAWAYTITVVTTLTEAIWGVVTATRAVTAATLAWAAANGLVTRTSVTAAGASVAGGIVRASYSSTGMVIKTAEETTAMEVARKTLPTLLGLLARYANQVIAAIEVTGAFIASLNPLTIAIASVGTGVLALIGFLHEFTSVGADMDETWGRVKSLLGGIGELLNTTVAVGFKLMFTGIEVGGAAVGRLVTELKALTTVLEQLPVIKQTKVLFDYINLGLLVADHKRKEIEDYLKFRFGVGRETNKAALDRLDLITAELVDREVELQDAKDALIRAKVVPDSPQAKSYEARIAAAKKVIDTLKEEREKVREGLNEKDTEFADFRAAYFKQLREEAKVAEAGTAAQQKLGKQVIDGKMVSKEFAEANTSVKNLIDLYQQLKRLSDEAEAGKPNLLGIVADKEKTDQTKAQLVAATLDMFAAIEKAGPTVTDAASRAMLDAQIARVLEMGVATPAQQAMLKKIGISMGIQIAKYVSPATQASEAFTVAAFKNQEALRAASLEYELELTRQANEKQEREDTESMNRSEMMQDEFDLRKRGRKQAEIDLEIKQGENVVEALIRRQRQGIDKGPEAQMDTATALVKAENDLRLLRKKKAEELAAMGSGQEEAARKIARDIAIEVAQQVAEYGTLVEALEAVRLKYQALEDDLKGADPTAVRNRARKEAFDLNIKYLERDMVVAEDRARERKATIAVEKQAIDLAQERVDLDLKAGRITSAQAQQQKNALVYLDQANAAKTLAEDRLLLDTKQIQIDERRALILKDQAAQGKEAGSMETLARITRDIGPFQKEIDALILKIGASELAIARMSDKIVNYSKVLKEHFVSGLADALTTAVTDFKHAGDAMVNLSKSISNEIVSIFMHAFTERLFQKIGLFSFVDKMMDSIFGHQPNAKDIVNFLGVARLHAQGGVIEGPGTGTSDSVPAMLSAGEHVMPAAKTAQWLPVLEAIRTGRLGMALGGLVQPVAFGSLISRRYVGGGIVSTDGGAAAVMPGGGLGNMMVQLHPDALNMTMRDWLEHEVVRQHSRR